MNMMARLLKYSSVGRLLTARFSNNFYSPSDQTNIEPALEFSFIWA